MSLSESICPDGYLNITFTRKTKSPAAGELFRLINPETEQIVYESWNPSNDTLETRSSCVLKTENNTYYIEMDFVNNQDWKQGSWLEILGIYGNRVFRAGFEDRRYTVCLFNPINKNDEWYLASQYYDDWYLMTSDDWEKVSHTSTSGSFYLSYYRRSFISLNQIAAYEVQLYYRHGIVVYVDGREIYRDNMAAGPVLPTARPINEYESYSYRGVIRPGNEVPEGSHVIAVEVHRLHHDPVDFDCWLALYGSSFPNGDGLVYSVSVEDVMGGGVSVPDLFDGCMLTSYIIHSFNPGSSAFFYTIRPAMVNMWVFWRVNISMAVSEMKFQRYELYSDELMESDTVSIPSSEQISFLTTDLNAFTYSDRYAVYPMKVTNIPFEFSDLLPYVSNLYSVPFILPLKYLPFYELTVNESVSITPAEWRDKTCACVPDLPEGLKLDYCAIRGIPTILQSNITYHIYAYDKFGTKRYTIILSVIEKELEEVKETIWWPILIIIMIVIILLVGLGFFFYFHTREKIILPIVHLDSSPVNPVSGKSPSIPFQEGSLSPKQTDLVETSLSSQPTVVNVIPKSSQPTVISVIPKSSSVELQPVGHPLIVPAISQPLQQNAVVVSSSPTKQQSPIVTHQPPQVIQQLSPILGTEMASTINTHPQQSYH